MRLKISDPTVSLNVPEKTGDSSEKDHLQTIGPVASRAPSRELDGLLSKGVSSAKASGLYRGLETAITNRVNKQKNEAYSFDAAEREIAKRGFVNQEHLRPLSTAINYMNAVVSFRLTGPSSIKRIEKGAEPKGSDIKSKTIKLGTVDEANFAAVEKAEIDGYVGAWENGKPIGLHMGKEAEKFRSSSNPAEAALASALKYQGTHPYLPIEMGPGLESSLNVLKQVPGWEKLPVTGDYDLHDMVYRKIPVPSASPDEARIVVGLNAAISAVDNKRPLGEKHLELVQHGPQVNYVAYQLGSQRGSPTADRSLVKAVAEPSFPLAFCDGKSWSIVENHDEYLKYMEEQGLVTKDTWSRKPSWTFADKLDTQGKVSLRRVSDESSSND